MPSRIVNIDASPFNGFEGLVTEKIEEEMPGTNLWEIYNQIQTRKQRA